MYAFVFYVYFFLIDNNKQNAGNKMSSENAYLYWYVNCVLIKFIFTIVFNFHTCTCMQPIKSLLNELSFPLQICINSMYIYIAQ